MDVEFNSFVLWVLSLSLIVLGILAWKMARESSRDCRRAVRRRALCRLCLAIFEVEGQREIYRCPRCLAKTGKQGPTPLG